MSKLARRFDFAGFNLSVESRDLPCFCQATAPIEPSLPGGMRIDACEIDALTVECVDGAIFAVQLDILPADKGEWEQSWDSGEHLDAMSFRSPDRFAAAIGMRDPEWMGVKYSLQLLDSQTTPTSLRANYRATAPTKACFQVATAWTSKTSNDQEKLASWFAVDKALSF